jgi:hypothetical protein
LKISIKKKLNNSSAKKQKKLLSINYPNVCPKMSINLDNNEKKLFVE